MQRLSIISSLRLDLSLVMKSPAALKQCSASTDEGGKDSKLSLIDLIIFGASSFEASNSSSPFLYMAIN